MQDPGNITRIRVPPREFAPGRAPTAVSIQSGPRIVRGTNPLVAWLALAGVVLPTEMQIFIAGAKFTPGRIGVILLLLPALFTFAQRGRRVLLCDLFACATAVWMIAAGVVTGGLESLSSPGAESLEFLGGYAVARGLFFGPAALHTFIRVLKVIAITSIIFAIADSISGRLIVHDTIAAIFQTTPPIAGYRQGMVRAASTFDHEILFGVFCSLMAAMFLYSELSVLKRTLWVGLCFVGCILSLSSAALMAFSIALVAYLYDRVMRRYPWRWSVFWVAVAALTVALFLVSNDPVGWVISHLTLDPQTGYYRLWIWNAALAKISESPLTGFSFNSLEDNILDHSVDCVWLVSSLRFGVPMVIFLFLTNVAALLPTGRSFKKRAYDSYIDQIRPAFTMVLVLFMFTGLTVHFWNYMWIFWGLCIGIRASLRERSIEGAGR